MPERCLFFIPQPERRFVCKSLYIRAFGCVCQIPSALYQQAAIPSFAPAYGGGCQAEQRFEFRPRPQRHHFAGSQIHKHLFQQQMTQLGLFLEVGLP